MRKITCLIIVILLVVGLSSCGRKATLNDNEVYIRVKICENEKPVCHRYTSEYIEVLNIWFPVNVESSYVVYDDYDNYPETSVSISYDKLIDGKNLQEYIEHYLSTRLTIVEEFDYDTSDYEYIRYIDGFGNYIMVEYSKDYVHLSLENELIIINDDFLSIVDLVSNEGYNLSLEDIHTDIVDNCKLCDVSSIQNNSFSYLYYNYRVVVILDKFEQGEYYYVIQSDNTK
jgi:hypothetical protein